jgi:superfamily II DNA or RNA helicase
MFDKSPPQVDMVIVDEAQHDAARSMSLLHERVKPRHVLGLSATPYRTDRVKLCFQQVIRDVGIQRLIQDGYLAPYHHYTIPDFSPRSVAECFCREQERWGQSLLFFHRYRDCLRCRDELAARGVHAEIVSAASNRERQIDQFAAGEINVLISMAILAEGFDCPSLKTVFCRPSGKSCTIQMGGRAFRRHPGIEFKQIVQCRATRHPFMKTAEPREQYGWMDGGWRTLKLNRKLAEISSQTLKLVAASPVSLPKIVAQHRPRRPYLHRLRSL